MPYTLRHSRRKTLGMSVDARGLRVAAPLRMAQRQIDAFILGHGDWVIRTLDAWAARPAPKTLVIEDGCVLPLLGEPCRLQLTRGLRFLLYRCAATLVDISKKHLCARACHFERCGLADSG